LPAWYTDSKTNTGLRVVQLEPPDRAAAAPLDSRKRRALAADRHLRVAEDSHPGGPAPAGIPLALDQGLRASARGGPGHGSARLRPARRRGVSVRVARRGHAGGRHAAREVALVGKSPRRRHAERARHLAFAAWRAAGGPAFSHRGPAGAAAIPSAHSGR